MSIYRKTVFISALCAVIASASCSKMENEVKTDTTNSESMYQIATLQSLMVGNYDGYVSVGELRKQGDIGLGTFERVDGEMIVLDGTVYQARYDGSVNIADDRTGVPFATVTTFEADIRKEIGPVSSMKDLTDRPARI